MDYTKYKIRTCKSLHHCEICNGDITLDQKYYDGGYGRRAHDLCADADELEPDELERQENQRLANANVI